MDQLTKVHYLFEPHGQSRRLMRQPCRNCTSLLEMVQYVMVINQGPARTAEHVACTVEGRITYRDLVGKPEAKSPLERLRRRCKYNIKIGIEEVKW